MAVDYSRLSFQHVPLVWTGLMVLLTSASASTAQLSLTFALWSANLSYIQTNIMYWNGSWFTWLIYSSFCLMKAGKNKLGVCYRNIWISPTKHVEVLKRLIWFLWSSLLSSSTLGVSCLAHFGRFANSAQLSVCSGMSNDLTSLWHLLSVLQPQNSDPRATVRLVWESAWRHARRETNASVQHPLRCQNTAQYRLLHSTQLDTSTLCLWNFLSSTSESLELFLTDYF